MNRILILPALIVVCAGAVYLSSQQSPSRPELLRCVDYKDHVVDPSFCAVKSQPAQIRGSLHPEPMYRPYYGGFGGSESGSRAWGGTDIPMRGHLYQNPVSPQGLPAVLDSEPQPYVVSHPQP